MSKTDLAVSAQMYSEMDGQLWTHVWSREETFHTCTDLFRGLPWCSFVNCAGAFIEVGAVI